MALEFGALVAANSAEARIKLVVTTRSRESAPAADSADSSLRLIVKTTSYALSEDAFVEPLVGIHTLVHLYVTVNSTAVSNDAFFDALVDTLGFSASLLSFDHAQLRERVLINGAQSSLLEGDNEMESEITFSDLLAVIHKELMEISVEFGVTDSVDSRALVVMVDRLLTRGIVSNVLEAHQLLTAALLLDDTLSAAWFQQMLDSLDLNVDQIDRAKALETLIDAVEFEGIDEFVATLHVLLPDSVDLSAGLASLAELSNDIRDEISLVLRLSIDNGEYTAWTINTATAGNTRYNNYPFNGYLQLGGRYYATSEQGLYLLEGDSDQGAQIAASIRAGMSKLGNGNMKGIQSMYLGYRADGDMLVKVTIADDHTGKRETHTYRLVERGGASQREHRVPIGRGLQSVYWDYEIHNADGADFELDSVEILPLVHERRIRGSSGGKA